MLKTETRNSKTMHIDEMDTISQLKLMSDENMNAVTAVGNELESIAAAVEKISEAFNVGGRLFYIGAGTSGRLGVLDAAECPPTFGVDYDRVIGIIAGGDNALRKASENAEDSESAGIEDLKRYILNCKDVVVGISAAGGAAYVVNAVNYANTLGCTTVGITSNMGSLLDKAAKISICTDTGAEVITGSTRLKAGTAQKLVLNMLTTVSFIKCGYVYQNMMVNLKPSNIKLKQRMVTIVEDILKCSEKEATEKLEKCRWSIPEILLQNEQNNVCNM